MLIDLSLIREVSLGLAGSVWGSLLHAGKISQHESRDFEHMFIKSGDSETKEGLRLEAKGDT